MGEIDSDIGHRQLRTSVANRRMTVPDESGSGNYATAEERLAAAQMQAAQEARARRIAASQQPHMMPQQDPYAQHMQAPQPSPEEIMAAREDRAANMDRASSHAKRRVELLVGIGRSTRDIEVDGHQGKMTISLRTLKSREVRKLLKIANMLAQDKNPDVIYAVREQTLAFSIYAIDGHNIDTVLGCEGMDEDECLHVRSMFLDELDESMLNFIYSKYQELSNENAEKYGVETAADAKEVAEQVRKSSQGE